MAETSKTDLAHRRIAAIILRLSVESVMSVTIHDPRQFFMMLSKFMLVPAMPAGRKAGIASIARRGRSVPENLFGSALHASEKSQ
jgi:hypothetical protein